MICWRSTASSASFGTTRSRNTLVRRDNSEADVRSLTSKLDPSLVSYTNVIGIGLLQPKVAVALYLAIALFVIIPFRAVIRLIRRAVAARRQKGGLP